MPINPLIPLAAGKINIDPSEAIARLGRAIQSKKAEGIASLRRERIDAGNEETQKLQQEKLRLQNTRETFNQLEANDKRRVQNNIIDSFKLGLALDAAPEDGKLEAGLQFIEQNKKRNADAGLDSNETLEAEALLRSGKLDELNTMLGSNIRLGEALGLITTPKAPQTRELKSGGKVLTQEFDPATRTFNTIAEADRFKPVAKAAIPVSNPDGEPEEIKEIDGVTYIKIDGKWFTK